MKRVKTNYHTLQVLKTAEPKLRKAIISNCNKELVKLYKRECLERSERQYIADSLWHAQATKHKAALRKVVDRHVPLSDKKKLSSARGIPAASSYETDKIMLRKMYLIPADRLHGSCFKTRALVSIRKHRETVKKRKHHPYAEAVNIHKHHPMRSGLRCVKRWTMQT